jgi:hypothetical protein
MSLCSLHRVAFALVLLAGTARAAAPTPTTPATPATPTGAPAGDVVTRPRLIVLDLRDPTSALNRSAKQALTEAMLGEAARFEMVESFSLAELRAVLELETTKQEAGCETNDCAADIANAMGGRYVLLSTVSRLGSSWQLTVSLYDSANTAAVGRGTVRAVSLEGLALQMGELIDEALAPLGKPLPRKQAAQPEGPRAVAGPGDGLVHIAPEDVELTSVIDPASFAACGFDTKTNRYDCGTAPTAVLVSTGTLATAGTVTFNADLSRGCVGNVKASIVVGSEAGRVDFQAAVGTEDGVARPLKPALSTAPIGVPPGARAVDTLRPPGGCLGTAQLVGAQDQVTVEVPYTVAGNPQRAIWVRKRSRQQVDPRVLLEQLPQPPRPTGVRPAEGAPWWWGTTTALVVGAAGATAGVGLGASLLPPSSTPQQYGLVGGFLGTTGALLLGVPALVVGAWFDMNAYSQWEDEEDKRLKARMHTAWEHRLE